MISLVIPSRKGSEELNEECAESYRETAKTTVEIVVSEDDQPFAVNVNRGIKKATGEIICVINNDSIGLPGWDAWIEKAAMKGIAAFTSDPECGWAFGASREIWDRVGLLDEEFVNSYEDRDFFIRAAIEGYRIIPAPRSFAIHEGGRTINKIWGPWREHRAVRIGQCLENKKRIQGKYPNLDVDQLINSLYFAYHGPEILKKWRQKNAQPMAE